MEQTFQITKKIKVVCNSEGTRYGFRHIAKLYENGHYLDEAKCCYYNRTWERYTYESVLKKLINKTTCLTVYALKKFKKIIKGDEGVNKDMQPLKNIATIMTLGEVFCKDQKEKNDWKARMLKAGLENKGLEMPEDWNSLTEQEKEKRLNGVTNILKGEK